MSYDANNCCLARQAAASASARSSSRPDATSSTTSASDSATPTSSGESSTAASSTAASSTGALFTAPTDILLPLDCDGLEDNMTVTYNRGDTAVYNLKCNMDTPYGDMAVFLAYSLSDCLQACSTYNWYHANQDCKGAVFFSNMQAARIAHDGNCWLKSELGDGYGKSNFVIGTLDTVTN